MRTRTMVAAGLALLATMGALAETAVYHTTKTMAPKPGKTLRVEASFQDITVEIAPGTVVDITVDLKLSTWPQDPKEAIKAYEPVFEEVADGLLVRSRSKVSFGAGITNSSGTIAVRMPSGMHLKLDTGSGDILVKGEMGGNDLACETGSGDVRIEGTVRDLSADTGSGDVVTRLTAPARSAAVDTGSGDIEFHGGAAKLKAEAGSGNISADGLEGPASFDTGSGDIQVRWSALPPNSAVDCDTGSGNILLTLPPGAILAGAIETSSGDIRSDFPGTSSSRGRRWAFAGGPGSAPVSIGTGSGDVSILKK